jgi:hypothetical protein
MAEWRPIAEGPWSPEVRRLAKWMDVEWAHGVPPHVFRQFLQLLLAEQAHPGEADKYMWETRPSPPGATDDD